MTKPKKSPHEGSTLDDFLREKGLLEEVEAEAKRRVKPRPLRFSREPRRGAGAHPAAYL
jgi:hypothetical protein